MGKIFGVGLSKTGTTSLGAALTSLGFKTRHFVDTSIAPEVVNQIQSCKYRLPDLDDDLDAWVDTPISAIYADLDRVYPGSKFILTIRDKDSWLRSMERHFQDYSARREDRDALRLILYGCLVYDRDHMSWFFDHHTRAVKDYFRGRPEDFLVMDLTQGDEWEKLCGFLKLPNPDSPFPRKNVTSYESVESARRTGRMRSVVRKILRGQ